MLMNRPGARHRPAFGQGVGDEVQDLAPLLRRRALGRVQDQAAWRPRKAATSASTACASNARAPSRRTSVRGSENSAGWISLTTVSWIMAYHSFGGEVEARTPPRYAASIPHAVTNFRA